MELQRNRRLREFDKKARFVLWEKQQGNSPLIEPSLNVDDFSEHGFPEKSTRQILSSVLSQTEKQILLTYLLGCWYRDRTQGKWCYVPLIVDNPTLYTSFGIGVDIDGKRWSAAESVLDVVNGEPVDQLRTALEIDIQLANSSDTTT